ncbi:BZ3500_MvSof-1268-A1-R1_Chr2-2g04880 [Microbotryum saponariae]|uniref:succinate-semialdehyde dehydrogenase [NAD(P)(+)] n=1 Tax=Microbotryum saponariae TaxID=289078 RepID=A0A2X0L666_9BASI|nr:BZ3500_MvSof-1268-A1-R1_Chr2-2g04880 [Microbotryum saponariae]SDA00390.1 BZ3501_MvSof-1269-A2-R1_Chr2-2g04554 [Microbotryum saponariae]
MLRRSLTTTANLAIKSRALSSVASSSRVPLVGVAIGRIAPNCSPTWRPAPIGARSASTSSTSPGYWLVDHVGVDQRRMDLWNGDQDLLRHESVYSERKVPPSGRWAAASFHCIHSTDPGTGKQIGTLPDMGLDDTKQAIDRAYEAFQTWGKTSEYERSKILAKMFQLTNESAEDLAQILTAENGKPLVDARGEISYGGSFWEWYAGEAVRSYGDIIPSSVPGVQNTVIKQPVGFPNAMVTRKVGAALAAGCTVVIKAPSETPYSILAIAEIAKRAGVPDGVINVILTQESTSAVGKELCENPKVHKVSFTGSTRVGKILMKQSSESLKKLSMELGTYVRTGGAFWDPASRARLSHTGGNAPLIVFNDADLDKAVAGTIVSKFRLSGQTCVCANRILVQDGVYDRFASKLADAVRKFKVGEGTGEGITHGPLIHENAVKKVKSHVEDAKKKGAKVVVGGDVLDLPGYFFQPTVLIEVQRCAIDEDETFGPLAALYRFKTEAEAIERANEPDVGLAAYIFTENISRMHRVSAALETGMVGANTGAISQAGIPFGGVKQSGFGREGSKYGLSEYQIIKFVAIGGLN